MTKNVKREISMTKIICKQCNKKFNSQISFWNHVKEYHKKQLLREKI